jgi:hypothetical protein
MRSPKFCWSWKIKKLHRNESSIRKVSILLRRAAVVVVAKFFKHFSHGNWSATLTYPSKDIIDIMLMYFKCVYGKKS